MFYFSCPPEHKIFLLFTEHINEVTSINDKEVKEEIPTGINSEWDIQNGDTLHA